MANIHDRFERSCGCSCHKCTAVCKAMPGILAPGDVDRIARFLDGDPNSGELWSTWFDSAEPVSVEDNGVHLEAGTIVPKQDENGRCVFLNDQGRCSIHPVAPFGCSRFSPCQDDEDAPGREHAALVACATSADYQTIRSYLKLNGHNAASANERRLHLQAELDQE